jgi:rubrerythrin
VPFHFPNPRFAIAYEITPADSQRLAIWSLLESGAGLAAQRSWRRVRNDRFLLAIALTPLTVWLARKEWPEFYTPWLPFVFTGACVFFWTIAYRSARACSPENLKRLARRSAAEPQQRYHQGVVRLFAGDDEFLMARAHEDVWQRWTGICRVDQTDELIMLCRPDDRVFFIPFRAFASPEEAKAFLAFATDAVARSETSDVQTLRRYAETSDARCPACGYSLKGTHTTRCPECFHPLDRHTMPDAWHVNNR